MANNTENTSPDLMVTRDLKVGRNVTAGGNATVRGNVTVEHGLKVKGWLDADNMNFPTAGVFPMSDTSGGGDGMDNLRAEYPNPKNGMIAGVIDMSGETPVVYLCYSNPDGTWTKTEETIPIKTLINYTTDDVELQQILENLQAEIEAEIAEKMDKVSEPDTAKFPMLNASGSLVNGTHGPSSFAAANHTHAKMENTDNKVSFETGVSSESTDTQYPSAKLLYETGVLLGVQTAYFKDNMPSSAIVAVNPTRVPKIDPKDYYATIFYDSANRRFLAFDSTTGEYYTHWNKGGEKAYMDDNGDILRNKLYVNAEGTVFFCYGDFELVAIKFDKSDKVDKVASPTANNFPVLTAGGGIANSAYGPSSFASANHVHGNIQNGGALQTTDVTIARGDKVVVTDASDGGKVARTSQAFDGSTDNMALTKKGTFERFANLQDLGRAAEDTVRVTFNASQAGSYRLYNGDPVDLLMMVINGVAQFDSEEVQLGLGDNVVEYVFASKYAIPAGAFKGIEAPLAISAVHIPAYVHLLGEGSFANSRFSSGATIDCEGMTPPVVASDAFDGVTVRDLILVYHSVASSLYAASTFWNGFGKQRTYAEYYSIS